MSKDEIDHLKIKDLEHRNFRNDDFWKAIPGFASVSRGEFSDHMWQLKNSIRKTDKLKSNI